MESGIESGDSPKKIVLSFVDALNDQDIRRAETNVREDISFVGVLGSREGACLCLGHGTPEVRV